MRDKLAIYGMVWLLGVLGLLSSASAVPLTLSRTQGDALESGAYVWKDESRTLSFEQIYKNWQERRSEWQTVVKTNFGISPVAYWFALPVEQGEAEAVSYLIENAYPLVDEIDLYILKTDGSLERHYQAGDARQLSLHSLPSYHPAFPVYLQAGEQRLLLFRLQSLGTLVFQPKLWTSGSFIAKLHPALYAMGAYAGLIAMMLIYHSFMYLQLRERVNLSYLMFLLGNGTFQIAMNGFGFYLFWPEAAEFSNLIPQLAGALGLFAATDFTVCYLKLEGRARWLDRLIVVMKALSVIIFVAALVLPYDKSLKIFSVSAALCFVFYLVSGFVGCLQRSRTALYFTAAWLMFGLGMLIIVIRNFGLLPSTGWTMASVQIGSTVEVILLSVGVVDRIQEERRERMKARDLAARAEKVMNLEVKTRFHLASELAHRLNNPLNYIETSVLNMEQHLSQLEAKTLTLLSGDDAEMDLVRRSFLADFQSVKEILGTLHRGVFRSSQSVREIKILSGIEGVDYQNISLSRLIEDLLARLRENIGDEYYHKLPIKVLLDEQLDVCVNTTIFQNALEHLLRQALTYFQELTVLSIESDAQAGERLSIEIKGHSHLHIHEFRKQEETYGHILQTTHVMCHLQTELDHIRVILQIPTQVPTEQVPFQAA